MENGKSHLEMWIWGKSFFVWGSGKLNEMDFLCYFWGDLILNFEVFKFFPFPFIDFSYPSFEPFNSPRSKRLTKENLQIYVSL